jgi:UDP-hydrolysing UDP-N-acetyl-D-glucosamine 2-epimerase
VTRSVGVVTSSRADFGILLPILRAIEEQQGLELRLYVTGTHLSEGHGRTITEIRAAGFRPTAQLKILDPSDRPVGTVRSMAAALEKFGSAFARRRPDIVVVLGDRFEMHAAAVATVPFTIPLAHIHGGEETLGAIDNSFRNSLTKLSHLHFVSTQVAAARVIAMGEEPWRVTISGAPALDNLSTMTLLSVAELTRRLGLDAQAPFLLVTFHPTTLEPGSESQQVDALLEAVERIGLPCVFTAANADAGGRLIDRRLRSRTRLIPHFHYLANLGTQAYFSTMARAAAMVGNSSSGIIEAASFGLPVVNVGSRQEGRERGRNVLDAAASADDIVAAIRKALSPEFRAGIAGMANPYGSGGAGPIIARRLAQVPLDDALLRKRLLVKEMP